MHITLGPTAVTFPSSDIAPLRDSSAWRGNSAGLLERFDEDGYLFMRGFHPRAEVQRARDAVVQRLAALGVLDSGDDGLDARRRPGTTSSMSQLQPVTRDAAVSDLLESPRLFEFFSTLFGEAATTYEFKWLRAVGEGGATGVHYDVVYMGRGSQRVHTIWTPFGDVPLDHGPLAVCAGSHRLESYARLRATYGQLDVDRDRISDNGWFTEDPLEVTRRFGGQWQTAAFAAGDVLVFGLYTLHASCTNTSDRWRISCDTRFQPAGDPLDERWGGAAPTGHTHFGHEGPQAETVADARKRWGL